MVTKAPRSTERDAEATREKLLRALKRMILRDGLAAVGVNALAREAGCDKVLIYRYFGDLDGLYEAFAEQSDFWWTLEELTKGIDPRRVSLSAAMGLLLRRHGLAIRRREVTLAVIGAEPMERSPLVIALETVRERRSLELGEWVARNYRTPRGVDIAAIAMLLGVALNYIAARSTKIRVMSGVGIRSDADWERILDATSFLARAALSGT
jgi:AcrR family transcriptional regulator